MFAATTKPESVGQRHLGSPLCRASGLEARLPAGLGLLAEERLFRREDEPFPGLVRRPLVWEVDDLAGSAAGFEEAQAGQDHGPLIGRIEWASAGATERVVEEDAAGREHRGGDVAGAGEGHGGDPVGLEVPGDQTHGLMADRSDGHEERGVHLVFAQLGEDLGGVA
jgi:hypothetical protein